MHNGVDTACLIQIFHIGRTCRCQMAEVRCPVGNFIGKFHVQLDAAFMRNGRKMQHGVRGTSKRHIHRHCIGEGRLCHDVPRTDILSDHIHDRISGFLRKTDTCRIYCRNRSVSGKTHSDCLRQTVHGICRVHSGAGAAGRADIFLEIGKLFRCDFSGVKLSYRLKHGGKRTLSSIYMTGQHRAAGNKNSRDIDSCCRHQKAGNILVAVRNHNKAVKLVSLCHAFC